MKHFFLISVICSHIVACRRTQRKLNHQGNSIIKAEKKQIHHNKAENKCKFIIKKQKIKADSSSKSCEKDHQWKAVESSLKAVKITYQWVRENKKIVTERRFSEFTRRKYFFHLLLHLSSYSIIVNIER